MPANIRVLVSEGRRREVAMLFPASDIVSTELTLEARGAQELPTLVSVERLVGRLSAMGLVLASPQGLQDIATIVNTKFLPLAPPRWEDVDLRLRVQSAQSHQDQEVLEAIAGVREPTLATAQRIMSIEGRTDFIPRREQEHRLVDNISDAVVRDRAVWSGRQKAIALFVARTVLTTLVAELVGIPLVDIARTALIGIARPN